jgi:hypothetical protein
VALSVAGKPLETTFLGWSGSPATPTLTATVGTNFSQAATGSVTFHDTSKSNASLGTASLIPDSVSSSVALVQTITNISPPVFLDFNGDGIPDQVIVVNRNILNVQLGYGDGTFGLAVSTSVSELAYIDDIQAADFNSDGILDLVMVGQSLEGGEAGVVLLVLLGKGDGTFTVASTIEAQSNYYFGAQYIVADVNNRKIGNFVSVEVSRAPVAVQVDGGHGSLALILGCIGNRGLKRPVPFTKKNPDRPIGPVRLA